MASRKEYLDFVLEQLSGLEGVSYRAMMGEYLLYYNDKLFGGIYDDRFLVKVTASSLELLPDAPQEMPYDGAKPMLLITEIDNKNYLRELILAMYEDLPEIKKRVKRIK
ncbi:TfoX/Sxy family protein [Frisingicoccus caecimuris]|uniref:TfoX-like protein n=1 Tax=Frisingicoccus caecimuris TaxID=1796636 RepID=A0A4R2LK00_9FIRM|nr:TfoX/Sxy family protein [Frisingicoccus caecimuris]MCR1919613.1 TfoX/Sxy family protein [Frisingicoccus caecimuris]TCO83566.1 TfoX-like protein [Frisingicoccus caecimuris]